MALDDAELLMSTNCGGLSSRWARRCWRILPSHGKPSAPQRRPWCLRWSDFLSRPCCTPSRRSWSSLGPPAPGRRGFVSVAHWHQTNITSLTASQCHHQAASRSQWERFAAVAEITKRKWHQTCFMLRINVNFLLLFVCVVYVCFKLSTGCTWADEVVSD